MGIDFISNFNSCLCKGTGMVHASEFHDYELLNHLNLNFILNIIGPLYKYVNILENAKL